MFKSKTWFCSLKYTKCQNEENIANKKIWKSETILKSFSISGFSWTHCKKVRESIDIFSMSVCLYVCIQ